MPRLRTSSIWFVYLTPPGSGQPWAIRQGSCGCHPGVERGHGTEFAGYLSHDVDQAVEFCRHNPQTGTNLLTEMAHSARAVANAFIDLGVENGNSLTPLQIMKLVYLAHGWMLALHDRELVEDQWEAWKYGPVVDDLYHAMKMYRADPVTHPIPLAPVAEVQPDGRVLLVEPQLRSFDRDEWDIIQLVYDHFGHWPAARLVQITHQPGTPWYWAWFSNSGTGRPIPKRHIRRFFKSKVGVS